METDFESVALTTRPYLHLKSLEIFRNYQYFLTEEWKILQDFITVARKRIELMTSALLARRSNQLS